MEIRLSVKVKSAVKKNIFAILDVLNEVGIPLEGLTGDDEVVRAFLQRRKECYVQALERCQRKLDGIEKMSKLVGDEIEQIKMRQHQISNGNPANDDWTQLDQLSQRQCDLWRKRWMLSNLIKAYRHYSARGGPDDGLVTISLGR